MYKSCELHFRSVTNPVICSFPLLPVKTGQLEWRGSSLSTFLSGENAPYTSRIYLCRAGLHSLCRQASPQRRHLSIAVLGGLSDTLRVPSSSRRVTPALSFCFRSRGGGAVAQGRRSSQGPDQRGVLRQRGGNSRRARESTVTD